MRKPITIRVEDNDMHSIEEIALLNSVTRNQVITGFIKSSLKLLDSIAEYAFENDINFLQRETLEKTIMNVRRMHYLIEDLIILQDVRDIITNRVVSEDDK